MYMYIKLVFLDFKGALNLPLPPLNTVLIWFPGIQVFEILEVRRLSLFTISGIFLFSFYHLKISRTTDKLISI